MDELFSCRNCIQNCGQSLLIGRGAGYCVKHDTKNLTALWQKCGPCPGRLLSRTIVGDFTDASSAESYLKANSPTGSWPYLFFYQLELMLKYRIDNRYPVTIFDRNGNMRGGYDNYKSDCFPGRMEADCRFKIGDIVQFGHHKLLLGVVESLPPDPAFVAQVEGQNGMLDAVDDSYLVLCGKGGKEHDHLHECELFEPDAPVPRSMTALQKEILAGNWRTPSPVLVQTCGEIMTRLLNNPRKKRQRRISEKL